MRTEESGERTLRALLRSAPLADVDRLTLATVQRRAARRGARRTATRRVAMAGVVLVLLVGLGVVSRNRGREPVDVAAQGGPSLTLPSVDSTLVPPYEARMFAVPLAIAPAPGGVLVAAAGEHRVWLLRPDGSRRLVAGTGVRGYSGDGGPAAEAQLAAPWAAVSLPSGEVVIADAGNDRVRRVRTDGTIHTIGEEGAFSVPKSLAVTPRGTVLVAATAAGVVREVGTDGVVRVVAGTGERGSSSGDGGPALQAAFATISTLATGPDGSIYIGDATDLGSWYSAKIRRVRPDGIIETVVPGQEPAIQTVSSMYVEGDSLYFVDNPSRALFRVSLRTRAVQPLPLGALTGLHGVAVDERGHLRVSDLRLGVVHDLGPIGS